jgi:hypothetical protein
MEGKLTVFFESPFWVGIFERTESGKYQAARFVFGAEPTEPQLIQFALTEFLLLRFSDPVDKAKSHEGVVNYKRRMRDVKKQMMNPVGSTRAQLAVKQEFELQARLREQNSRMEHEADAERKFQLRQAKRAEKHRGH